MFNAFNCEPWVEHRTGEWDDGSVDLDIHGYKYEGFIDTRSLAIMILRALDKRTAD